MDRYLDITQKMSFEKPSNSSPSSSSSSPSSAGIEDKVLRNNTMTSSAPIQPLMSQQTVYTSMATNSCVSSVSTVPINSSVPSPVSNQPLVSNTISNTSTLMPQPTNQINIPVQQATVIGQSPFQNVQNSRVPTPQPQQQQILNQPLQVQNSQNISASLATPQPNQITQQIVQATSQTPQYPGHTSIQPMNIQLQHPQQISLQQTQQAGQPLPPAAQPAPNQQNLTSQVHQIQAGQQPTQHIVQQHPGAFNISQGQATLTVSMSQPNSVTPPAHIAPTPQAVAAQPAVAQSPVPQLQVIQHPLQNSAYVHPLYTAGTHQGAQLIFPSNLTIQPANVNAFHSLGVNQAATRNITLPQSSIDPSKQQQATTIVPVTISNKAATTSSGSLVPQAGQIQIASSKTPGSQILSASAFQQGSKSVYTAGQPGQCSYTIPCSNVNGQPAFVIGQLGVLPTNAQHASTIVPAKAVDPSQKQKSFTMGISPSLRSPLHQTNKVMSGAFQSKSTLLPHPACTTATVISGTHLKQLTSSPQVIASQAPTAMIASQAQILAGSFQTAAGFGAPGNMTQGIHWASPNIQSPTMIQPNTQFLIRGSQQGDMIIQSPASHPTFQAVAQPQIQPQQAVMTTSGTPVASVAPSSTTTITTTSASAQKPKQTPEMGSSNILPKSCSGPPIVTTISSTTRNLSTILPATTSTIPTVPMAQVRPASAVQTSPIKAGVQQNKVKGRPRLYPGVGANAQYPMRPALVGVGQKMERQTQTLSIQPKQRSPTVMKPTTVAQKLAGVSSSQSTKPLPKLVVSSNQTKPSSNVNVVAPELIQEAPSADNMTSNCNATPERIPSTSSVTDSSIPKTDTSCSSSVDSVISTVQEKNKSDKNSILMKNPTDNLGANKSKILEETKDKQPQKAIIKPNILTHVIEGYVILEGSEPFPVNRSSNGVPPQNNDLNGHSAGNSDANLIQCEFCGKSGLRSIFPGSKRFCSKSCAKRYNVGCSIRVGMFKPADNASIKKRKTGVMTNKPDGKSSSEDLGNMSKSNEKGTPEPPLLQDESLASIADRRTPESSSVSSLDEMESEVGCDDSRNTPPTLKPAAPPSSYLSCYSKNPVKWTVQEVYEFVQSLPGCTDYADEFLSQEIDGQALMLLKEEHLVTTMNIKLGPALKICSKVSSLRKEHE